MIPERADQKANRARRGRSGGRPPAFDRDLYKARNVVEPCFNRLKQFRAAATRSDKLAVRYRAGSTSQHSSSGFANPCRRDRRRARLAWGAQSCRASRSRPGMNSSGPARGRHDHLMRGGPGDIPTTTVFPFLTPADVDSLHQVVRVVDEARRGGDTADWEWFPEHAVFSGRQVGTPIILGLDAVEHAEEGDELEFLLQVVWTDLGQLAVGAAVNVACWCRTDHATHDVDALTVVVSDEIPLPEALRDAATRLTGWLAKPHDADYWRAKARLPPR